ncbi:MAG: hypothetical protein EOP68_14415 [Sphingomonas sp.]|nr:MAG: hypothetical protein EOP68_14415 [Sphingomonas sp.]
MIVLQTGAAVALGAILFVLVLGAAALAYVGLHAGRSAAAARRQLARLQATLRGAPALAMLVRADGRIEMAPSLAGWLGLDEARRSLCWSAPTAGSRWRRRSPVGWGSTRRRGRSPTSPPTTG